MSFIRDLHIFINLIVLLLFALQRVDSECEKDIVKIKEIFTKTSLVDILQKNADIPAQMKKVEEIENKVNELRQIVKMQEESTSNPAHNQIHHKLDQMLKNLRQVRRQIKPDCSELLRKCLNQDISEIIDQDDPEMYELHFDHGQITYPLVSCSFTTVDDQKINFFYAVTAHYYDPYVTLFKNTEDPVNNVFNINKLEFIAVISANDLNSCKTK